MSFEDEYFRYLQSRSSLGLLYREKLLYPKLSRFVLGKVLDVGCGIGDFLKFQDGCVGVDINRAAVEYCQSKGQQAYLMNADEIPFENGYFDTVVMDNVLEHIAEPGLLIHEITRVLCSTGRLIIGVPGIKGYAADDDHKVFYELQHVDELISKFGFSKFISFGMPLNMPILSAYLRQYCLYAVFDKSSGR